MTTIVRALGPPGAYEVLVDGEVVGTVRKTVTRSNLRRVLVSTQWWGMTESGERIPEAGGYGKRADVVERLVGRAAS